MEKLGNLLFKRYLGGQPFTISIGIAAYEMELKNWEILMKLCTAQKIFVETGLCVYLAQPENFHRKN
jgi:hypothetical protein